MQTERTTPTRLAERVRLARQYGWRVRYESESRGFNSRLDPLQAAVVWICVAGLPVAVVNALVSFPPGAMGLALVPTRGVAAVAAPVDRLGGGVGLLNPLALLNVCTRGLGVGRGGLSRGPANPLAAHRAVNTTAPHATTPRISIAASPSTSFRD